uniref:glucuronosyltransferase n=1 Tax=Panagrolaimus superbus TaxID=310955 RepID=A0A914ZD63_9BILA
MISINLALFFFIFGFVRASEIALFPSSGCYSHDVMMREIGHEFGADNVSWVQIYLYEFGFGNAQLPKHWNKLLVNRVTEDAIEMQSRSSPLLWEMLLPFDHSQPWDFRGNQIFFEILQRSQRECSRLLTSGEFYKFTYQRKYDLVIVDHFIQECVTTMASLLNATTIQFSNWPIADGYITSLNIPAYPSYVAKTGTFFSSTRMTLLERARNTIFHIIIVIARTIQTYVINSFYARIGHSHIELYNVESNHLLYAGRSEFLVEPLRPINNRIKHFGCAACKSRNEYIIKPPKGYFSSQIGRKIEPLRNDNDSFVITFPASNNYTLIDCNLTTKVQKRLPTITLPTTTISTIINETEAEQRFLKAKHDFPDINFDELEVQKFIIVSFGSVAKVGNMPKKLFEIFLDAFEATNYLVLWATNSPPEEIVTEEEKEKMPKNIRMIQWAPIKLLLAHQNLQYIVCHGGVNTLNELLNFGVPVLGLPLQGDQPSNLKRLVELGLGEMIDIQSIWHGNLKPALLRMNANLDFHQNRARLVASMITSHRDLSPNLQNYWLNWAKRYGTKLKESKVGPKLFNFFYRYNWDYFAIPNLLVFSIICTGLIYLLYLE